jgi:hypothetical protein
MTTIGYARVSTDGQTLDAQHAALRDAGAERVFSEKISGAKTDRQRLAKAIAPLAEGDSKCTSHGMVEIPNLLGLGKPSLRTEVQRFREKWLEREQFSRPTTYWSPELDPRP